MSSVAYIQQLQKVFTHFKKNGGTHRPACCQQIELIDEDDLTNWYVQLVYRRGGRGGMDSRSGESSPSPNYDEEDFIVNLHLRFLDNTDDEAATSSSSHGQPQQRRLPSQARNPSPQPSRMPLVFVHSPRLVAPFIHFGALCALELMSQSNWTLTPLNMELLLIALHETLDPFAAGSSVQVVAEGVGQGAMQANHHHHHDTNGDGGGPSLVGVSRYTAEEHLDGIRYIRRAHPHLFRDSALSVAGEGPDEDARRKGQGGEEDVAEAATGEADMPLLSRAQEVSSFFLDGLRSYDSAEPQGAKRRSFRAGVDQTALARSLSESQDLPAGTHDHAVSPSSSSEPSLLVVAPSTLGRPRSLSFCALCPSPSPQRQHAVSVFFPSCFPRQQRDGCISFCLAGKRPTAPPPPTPAAAAMVALVLRQAPGGASSSSLATSRQEQQQQQSQLPQVSTCIIPEGCSLTLCDLTVYGHLRVMGRLTLVNCTFIGTLVAEGAARVTLRACDVALAAQERLLLALPPPVPAAPPTEAAERDSQTHEEVLADLGRDVYTSRLEGVLVLDSASVEVLDGCVVSCAVPFFTPSFPPLEDSDDGGRGEQTDGHATPGTGTRLASRHRRRNRGRRPRFSLRHYKTLSEQEEERLPPLRALFNLSNHARLRGADSLISPRQPTRCDHTIVAENDAQVELCNVIVAAGQSAALTLQGCRGHCERVLVTSTDALALAFHRKAHGLDNDNVNFRNNTGDEVIPEEERRLFTCPQPPPMSQERKNTGINVELGGVVTAKYCLAQYVYFGFSAIAQSVASFYGCHAQGVVNGFTIDASVANLLRCSAQATHVGVFVLNKAKCTLLSEEEEGEVEEAEGSSGGGGGDGGDNVVAVGAEANNTADDDAPLPHTFPVSTDYGYGQRCKRVRELTATAAAFGSVNDAVCAFLDGCDPMRRRHPRQVVDLRDAPSEHRSLCFSLWGGREDAGPPPGVTAAPLAIAQSFLTATTSRASLAFPLLHPFCVFLGGDLNLETQDAVLEVTGAVLVAPRDVGAFALAGSQLHFRNVIAWHPRLRGGEGHGAEQSAVNASEESEKGESDEASASRRGSASSSPLQIRSTYGASLKDGASLVASDCLTMGFTYPYFLVHRATAALTECMAAGCYFGYVVSSRATLSAAYCGATATAGAVLATEGARVELHGVPHVVGSTCDDDAGAGEARTEASLASGEHGEKDSVQVRHPPRAICGGCYLSAYRAGDVAVECRESTLTCTGVVILRGDTYGFNICANSVAKLSHCLVDVSPSDPARFLLRGHRPDAAPPGRGGHTYRQLLLDDGACFDNLHPGEPPLAPITNTERIASTAVRTCAGGVCEATEVEVRFAACAFLVSGPESVLCARRCRVRRVRSGFDLTDAAAAVLVRCRCHATFGLLVQSHARCTVVSGQYFSREVGFENSTGLLRILGHVKVLGTAQVGVRLDGQGCLEAIEPVPGKLSFQRPASRSSGDPSPRDSYSQQLLAAEEHAGCGGPTRLEICLSPHEQRRPLWRRARSNGEIAEEDSSGNSPLSPSNTADSAPPPSTTRSEYPVCLLMKGPCSATVQNGVFSSAGADPDPDSGGGGNNASPPPLSYGLRIVGSAQASLTACRFDGCFREACVRAGAGTRVTLTACELRGRTRKAAALDTGEDNASGTWYALEIHRGAVCVVKGTASLGGDNVPPVRVPPRHSTSGFPSAPSFLALRGVRAVWSWGWGAVTRKVVALLSSSFSMLPAVFRLRERETQADKRGGGGGGLRVGGSDEGAQRSHAPWLHRPLTSQERRLNAWMGEHVAGLGDALLLPRENRQQQGGFSLVWGRCLVTGSLSLDGVLFHYDEDEAATGGGSPAPSCVQLDVAKGASFSAVRCVFVVPPPRSEGGHCRMPLVFARHAGTTVTVAACLLLLACRTPPAASPMLPLCFLRVGDGAKARVSFLASSSSFPPGGVPWPFTCPLPGRPPQVRDRPVALDASLSLHVAQGAHLSIDASLLHSILLLMPHRPPTSEASCVSRDTPSPPLPCVHARYCLFPSSTRSDAFSSTCGHLDFGGAAVVAENCAFLPSRAAPSQGR